MTIMVALGFSTAVGYVYRKTECNVFIEIVRGNKDELILEFEQRIRNDSSASKSLEGGKDI